MMYTLHLPDMISLRQSRLHPRPLIHHCSLGTRRLTFMVLSVALLTCWRLPFRDGRITVLLQG